MNNPSACQHPQLGLCVMYSSAGIIERIGPDWDWLWLDGQHGELTSLDAMRAAVRACDLIGKPAYVRVAGHDPAGIGIALDLGAAAIIVPQVETAGDAKRLVQASKFPPLGNRSYGGRRPIDRHGRGYSGSANASTLLVCQIESPAALEAAESIADVEGVDALFLGVDDIQLCAGGDLAGGPDEVLLSKAAGRLGEICRKREIAFVCPAASAALYRIATQAGATHLVLGSDAGFLAAGSAEAARRARAPAGEGAIY